MRRPTTTKPKEAKAKKGRGGKSLTLTPAVVDRLVRAVRSGLTNQLAAKAAGVGQTTFYEWLARGRDEKEGICRDLVEAVEKAEGECAEECMRMVLKAARKGSWTAAAWTLERKFGYRVPVEVSGPDGGPLQIASWADLVKAAKEGGEK